MDKKKILASLISATMLTTPPVKAEENYKLGDIDSNGTVSADDASMVLMEYARNSTGATPTFNDLQKKAADIDKNKKIDATDATMILQYYSYLSTGGKLSFEDYLNEDKKNTTPVTTSTQQTTSTQTTTVTTQPPQVVEKDNYTKYDLLDPNPAVAAKAFERLSDDLCKDMLNGKAFYSEYGSTGGRDEAKIMLAVLNRNQGISMEMLALPEALGNYTEDEVILFSGLDASSAILEDMAGTSVDYNKYVLDEEYANFMNNTNRAFKEYQNGNVDEYNEISSNYFDLNDFSDYVKCYYMVLNDNLSNEYTSDESVEYAKNMYIENIIKPLYESYAPYKGHSYNR